MTTGSIAANSELEAIIARTALKYDLLPYTSNPFPQTQPGRLAALARLFGLETASMDGARVLELGCAGGGNIIPLAARYPDAKFVGVDLSRTQVAAGRERILQLGLRNIEIQCRSFTELTADDGVFDYIICHGVYSWVPAPVREAILAICNARLSPKGVAIVSYNVLPGWRMLQPLRDAFLMHAPDTMEPRQRVAHARSLLEFLKTYGSENGAYKQTLDFWASRFPNFTDDYIAHDFLEEVNDPCTFRDFIAAAGRHGLGFLSESELPGMILDNQPAETARKVREMSGNQLFATEQYMDLLTGRTFRQTLLVADARLAQVNRNIEPSRLAGLHVLTGGDMKIARDEKGGGSVTDSAGRQLRSSSTEVIDAIESVVSGFPGSSSVDALMAEAGKRGAELPAQVQEALFKMALVGLCTLTSEPVRATPAPSRKPVASALARYDAKRGDLATTNARHERIAFDSIGQVVLPALDGSNDVNALIEIVLQAVRAGRINFFRDGAPIADLAEREKIAIDQVRNLLPGFARGGLLEA